jgi:uncharacterized membrane protein YphA (DoxX/SURF4 family)
LGGALWVLQVLLGFFFAGSGFGKVLMYDPSLYASAPEAVAWYAVVPQGLIVFIGMCEVLGGIGLILPAMTRVRPQLTPIAAAGLALTMALAAVFHVLRLEFWLVPANVVLGGIAAVIAVGRWKFRPVTAGPVTGSGIVKSVAVLVVLALVAFAPTWYMMTRIEF